MLCLLLVYNEAKTETEKPGAEWAEWLDIGSQAETERPRTRSAPNGLGAHLKRIRVILRGIAVHAPQIHKVFSGWVLPQRVNEPGTGHESTSQVSTGTIWSATREWGAAPCHRLAMHRVTTA